MRLGERGDKVFDFLGAKNQAACKRFATKPGLLAARLFGRAASQVFARGRVTDMPMQMVGQVPDELRVKLSVWLTLFSLTAVSFALMYAGGLLIFGALYRLAETLTGYAFRADTLER